jgi:hypothetical protein
MRGGAALPLRALATIQRATKVVLGSSFEVDGDFFFVTEG